MMFTTPCFVRVEDAEKRDKLLAWCLSIGYFRPKIPREEQLSELVICDRECAGIVHNPVTFSLETAYIDCGTDIELFKALAAMNDENDYMQYFVFAAKDQRIDEFFLCTNQKWPKWALPACFSHGNQPRKATAEEIIEHFENRAK